MRIPNHEWLAQAQALPVGQSKRVRHNQEATPAMVVYNLPDRWIAKCHRCHRSAVQMKSHATLTALPDQKRFMPWPADAKALVAWPLHVQEEQYKLMLSKGFDWQSMAPDVAVWYSEKTGRLLFGTKLGWLGRATRGQLPKWCGYGFPAPAYGAHPSDPVGSIVCITEDLLSALKTRWAVRQVLPGVVVHAALGTELSDKHLRDLLEGGCKAVWCFMDGDSAGDKGAKLISARARGMGLAARVIPTPRGKDPKDMTQEEIQYVLQASV